MRIKKTAGYSNAKLHAKEQRKRDEAEDRNAQYARLTRAEKLQDIRLSPGESKRQLARLQAL